MFLKGGISEKHSFRHNVFVECLGSEILMVFLTHPNEAHGNCKVEACVIVQKQVRISPNFALNHPQMMPIKGITISKRLIQVAMDAVHNLKID